MEKMTRERYNALLRRLVAHGARGIQAQTELNRAIRKSKFYTGLLKTEITVEDVLESAGF